MKAAVSFLAAIFVTTVFGLSAQAAAPLPTKARVSVKSKPIAPSSVVLVTDQPFRRVFAITPPALNRTAPFLVQPFGSSSDPNQIVLPLPGEIVPPLPNQLTRSLPGQIVGALPGQVIRPLPGQLVQPLPGQIVPPLPGQITR